MKKSMRGKCLLCSVLFAGALALTGCGEEPYELEDNEREIIVNYAAHIIAKHNREQPEGYQYVYVSEEEEDEREEQPSDIKKEEQPETDKPQNEANDTNETNDTRQPEESQEPSVTLTEALGLSGVKAVYTGAELTDHYDTAVADDGKKLMILHVTLQNEGNKDADVDMASILPRFLATVNGSEQTTAEITILPDDLGTWEGTVPAGGTADTMIFFQLSDPGITSVEQLEMQVTAGKNVSRVVFL